MKALEKHGVSLLKGTLIIYLIFNFVNYIVHFIRIPAVIEAEYAIYGFKIALDLLICVRINKVSIALKRSELFMEAILVLDILEVLISITVVEKTFFIVALFCIGIALKLILQSFFVWFFYMDSLKYSEQVNHEPRDDKFTAIWILVHLFLPFCLIKSGFGILLFLLPIRGILEFLAICSGCRMLKAAIREKDDDTEAIYRLSPAFKRIKILFSVALSLCVICFLFFRYSYVEGSITCEETEQTSASWFTRAVNDHELDSKHLSDSEAENVLQYTVKNRLPYWSGFHSEKAGLVNIKTGENTGAIYKGRMRFDVDGIAYDNDGHFINYKGEKVCDVPKIVSADYSLRWRVASVIPRMVNTEGTILDSIYMSIEERSSKFVLSSNPNQRYDEEWGEYFRNGAAVYYSSLYDKYGIMSDNGEILTEPQLNYIDYFFDNGMVLAETGDYIYGGVKYSDLYSVLDSKGKEVLDTPVLSHNTKYRYNLITLRLCPGEDSDTGCYKIMNYDGEMIDGFFSGKDEFIEETVENESILKCKRYQDKTLSGTGEWVTFDRKGKVVE